MSKNARRPEDSEMYNDAAIADSYARSSKEGLVGWEERLFVERILRRMQGAGEGLQVLDVGTGPGWIPILLAKARPGWNITAVDYSEPMLEQARRSATREGATIRWLCRPAEDTTLPSNGFDLVLSHYTLHEFSDPGAVLREMVRVLKPVGLLLIQDMERPPALLMDLSKLVAQVIYRKDPAMKRQYLASIQATYTAAEIEQLLPRDLAEFLVSRRFSVTGLLLEITARKSQASE